MILSSTHVSNMRKPPGVHGGLWERGGDNGDKKGSEETTS